MSIIRTVTSLLWGAMLLAGCGGLATTTPLTLAQMSEVPTPTCGPNRLWIDTDAMVSTTGTADPDDGLALAMLRNCENIVGVSATTGNASVTETSRTVQAYATSSGTAAWTGRSACTNGPAGGMIAALEAGPLTIIGLGAATNIAQVISCRPDLVSNITQMVLVGGRTPGTEFWLRGGGLGLRFRPMHDLNYWAGPVSFVEVLQSGVPVALAGFEAGEPVRIHPSEVTGYVDPALLAAVEAWARTIHHIGGNGTIPGFDPVAVLAILQEDLFSCVPVTTAPVDSEQLVVYPATSSNVSWCLPRDVAITRASVLAYLENQPQ